MKVTHYTTAVVTVLTIMFFPVVSYASVMVFDTDKKQVSVGDYVEVSVLVDTQGDTINAIEGDIIFPASSFSLERIETGSSIVTMWVDKPEIDTPGIINFSGAIFNGFSGVISPQHSGLRPGVVMRLILRAKQQGSGVFSIKDAKTYKHDGRGTEIVSTSEPMLLQVVGERTQPSNQEVQENDQDTVEELPETDEAATVSTSTYAVDRDTTAPEPFTVEVVRSPDLHDGQYVLVFNAQDTGSGIDYYEVREVSQRFSIASVARQDTWKSTQSPHVLADQSLTRNIIVKAVDKAGNERIVHLPAENQIPWYENYIIILLAILSVGLIIMNLFRCRE